jgi:hypothetical protein
MSNSRRSVPSNCFSCARSTRAVWRVGRRILLSGLVCLFWPVSPVSAQEIMLDFNDGLLPSAHGWTYVGQCDGATPVEESAVASVSNGILSIDTATPFGVFSHRCAYWLTPLAPVDPSNFEVEIRMRAMAPDAARAACSGFLGAGLQVTGSNLTALYLMPSQLTLAGVAGLSCGELYTTVDGSNFHTYTVRVENGNLVTLLVDGQQAGSGTAILPWPAPYGVLLGDQSTSGGNVTAEIDFVRVRSLRTPITIDVKPGSDQNSINPGSRGNIPVAILTTPQFDATTVDPLSVRFGATGTETVPLRFSLQDVDGDGDTDLVLHFQTQAAGIRCGAVFALLTARTEAGQSVQGSDAVRTVGCDRSGT